MVGVVLLMGVGCLFFQGADSQSADGAAIASANCFRPELAWATAKRAVEKKLKSPYPASFPWIADGAIRKSGECSYVVRSYVDARNREGALTRRRFRAEVRYVNKTGRWKTAELRIK